MNRHEFFMKQAIAEAEDALLHNEVPIGAVVVSEDMIVSRARNMTETLRDPTAHAEMLAITAATDKIGGKYLNKCTIYVTIEPCPMCAAALGWAQIGTIVYGAADEKRGYSIVAPKVLHPKTKVINGICEEKCKELMVQFFKKRR